MIFSLSSNTFADTEILLSSEKTELTGNIKTTIRFDYPEKIDSVIKKNITISLIKDNNEIAQTVLSGSGNTSQNGYAVNVTAKNIDGMPITTEDIIYYFDIEFERLPVGQYNIRLSGKGYKEFLSPTVELDEYSKQIVVGTKDNTFTIGDINSDGAVNQNDLNTVLTKLGSNDETCDLNNDGTVNIIDIAYVNRQIGSEGNADLFETSLIVSDSDIFKLKEYFENNFNIEGNIEAIFKNGNENSIVIHNKNNNLISKNNIMTIPIEFNKEHLMEQVQISSPDVNGALEKGNIEVTYIGENNEDITKTIDFNTALPKDIYALEYDEGKHTVVINLGKRVPVKKITINVEKVKDSDGNISYAIIDEIKFIKDIVPKNPVLDNAVVKNIKVSEGNESVSLSWQAVPNVMGYKIYYGDHSGVYDKQAVSNTTNIVINNLENLKEYYFVITSTSGDWESKKSSEISAIPKPSATPLPPDFINIKEADSALNVSWKKTKDAVSYNVFIKETSSEDYRKVAEDIEEVSYLIDGLDNDIEYSIYITAKNNVGESKPSVIVTGTPKKEIIEIPKIPTLRRMDNSNIESIQLTDPNNVKMEFYPDGFDIWNVADGDYSTHWTSIVWYKNATINFTLKEPVEMDYLVYVPRIDGDFRKTLDTYNITVWEEGDDLNSPGRVLEYGTKIIHNSNTTGFAILPFEKTKVKKIAVCTNMWAGAPTVISLSEIAFYEYYSLDDRIKALFTDETFTSVSSRATLEEINSLREEVNNAEGFFVNQSILNSELELAEALLNNDSSALGVIKNGIQSRNAEVDNKNYQKSINTFEPLGIVAKANEKIIVYAKIPIGESVKLVPTQYYSEASNMSGTPIELANGRNIITVPKIGAINSERGGALYIQYSGGEKDRIKLHIKGGSKIPVLELYDWYNINESERQERINVYINKLEAYVPTIKGDKLTAILNSTEISMPNVLLSLPADKILEGINSGTTTMEEKENKLYNNALAWEDFFKAVYTTHGIDNTQSGLQSRQNIRYMRMFANAFMYASGNHIGVGYGSCAGLVQGKPVSMMSKEASSNNIFGWGIAHEVGHVMDKLGKAEITNNIYALMTQTYDGASNILKSRLETSNKYESIFDKTSKGYSGVSNDVFTQLGMYWQLHLAYDNADNPFDFYNRLHKEYRNGTASNYDYYDRFAIIASKTANKNLSDFFERWGITLSDSALSEIKSYPNESRAIYYLNDDSRRYRLSGKSGAIGSKISASVKLNSENNKIVDLTFNASADKNDIMGYEILRNGKPIAFSLKNDYTDTIDFANNMAFEYTIKAYDMLGNEAGMVSAGEIRVKYDNVISKDIYTLENQENGVISAKFGESVNISGIIIKGLSDDETVSSSVLSVKIKKDKDSDFVIAKECYLSDSDFIDTGKFINYFNKPGTKDSRIWLYEATEAMIEGLPKDCDIEFISYPGDNIQFTDTSVGKLKEDFVYDTLDGKETIKAGTLIITGNYRGDPVFNTVMIKGQYAENSSVDDEQKLTERAVNGYSLLFAEIPEEGEMSDISDGFFIFVPDIQKEEELIGSSCDNISILPLKIKAELYRTDTPDNASDKRLTSDTLWIDFPNEETLPDIILK